MLCNFNQLIMRFLCVVICYTSSSSPYQPPLSLQFLLPYTLANQNIPASFKKTNPKQTKPIHKSHQHLFSSFCYHNFSEPKPLLLSNLLSSLQRWQVTHQELGRRKCPPKGSKVNAPKLPSIAWIHGSQIKERRATTS